MSIEYLFSKIKAVVKELRGQTDEELIEAFVQGVLSITPKDVANTFEHCGYEQQGVLELLLGRFQGII